MDKVRPWFTCEFHEELLIIFKAEEMFNLSWVINLLLERKNIKKMTPIVREYLETLIYNVCQFSDAIHKKTKKLAGTEFLKNYPHNNSNPYTDEDFLRHCLAQDIENGVRGARELESLYDSDYSPLAEYFWCFNSATPRIEAKLLTDDVMCRLSAAHDLQRHGVTRADIIDAIDILWAANYVPATESDKHSKPYEYHDGKSTLLFVDHEQPINDHACQYAIKIKTQS